MSEEIGPIVSKEETFDKLEIRLGRVVSVEPAPDAPKPAYVIKADFGRFGVTTSVSRFTKHGAEELKGKIILGVLNLGLRQVGSTTSEFLCLGVQYPKADSGEATIITPLAGAKMGGKLFRTQTRRRARAGTPARRPAYTSVNSSGPAPPGPNIILDSAKRLK